MKKKNYKAPSIRSTCYISGLTNSSEIKVLPQLENYKCKITVLRKIFHNDLYDAYPYLDASACGRLEEGQVFVTDNVWDPPVGLCTWAWSDLRYMIHSIHAGNPGPMICSYTDGLRPVLFKLERYVP
jgi:uncharacterized repeat protein (TIGR04076 family)